MDYEKSYLQVLFQDADSCEQHSDGAGGVAAGLHAPRVPLSRGVRSHPQEDRDSQEVNWQDSSQHGLQGERKFIVIAVSVCSYLFVLTALLVVPFNSHQSVILD